MRGVAFLPLFLVPFLLYHLGIPPPSLGSPSPSGNYQGDHAALGAVGKDGSLLVSVPRTHFYLVSQLSWVVLCDSLWYACRVTSKQARINSRFLGGLCFSGLLISLSLLCSLDADIWKKFLSRPALPFILRLLRGLAMQHPATQVSNQHARGPYSRAGHVM